MLSGKFKHVIANDISEAPELFADALNGDINISEFPLTRDEFEASTDTLERLAYSFGNDMRSYIYSHDREEVCIAAERMMLGETVTDRYAAYKKFIKAFSGYLQCGDKTGSAPQAIEKATHLQAIERVTRLQAVHDPCPVAEFRTSRCDYRGFVVPAGSTVYADPPYKGTTISQYGIDFDYSAFEDWLASVKFPVFVSEYKCPRGCVEISKRESLSLADKSNSKRVIERLFVQERFSLSVL